MDHAAEAEGYLEDLQPILQYRYFTTVVTVPSRILCSQDNRVIQRNGMQAKRMLARSIIQRVTGTPGLIRMVKVPMYCPGRADMFFTSAPTAMAFNWMGNGLEDLTSIEMIA